MTPLQLQKYSDMKKTYSNDVTMFTNRPKSVANYQYRSETVKKAASEYKEVQISKTLTVLFYNL